MNSILLRKVIFLRSISIIGIISGNHFRLTQSVPLLIENGQGKSGTFIVGGSEATPHEFPWQVSILGGISSGHLCGGVLIDAYTVLTTARCADLVAPYLNSIAAGRHNLSLSEDESKQIVQISSIHIHPGFEGATEFSNDIAVLKTRTAFRWTEFVSPIPYQQDAEPISPEYGIISGWGTKSEEALKIQDVLQKALVKIVQNEDCQLLIGSGVTVEDSMICISSPNAGTPVDTCTGDEGGPLITIDENNNVVLTGLISFGIGCGRPNVPSFCTRISSYVDFIRQYQETKVY